MGYRLWGYKDMDMTERLSTKVLSKKFIKEWENLKEWEIYKIQRPRDAYMGCELTPGNGVRVN